MKIWLLEGPYFRYKEDVAKLAQENNLRIIDSRLASVNDYKYGVVANSKDCPKVALKPEYKPAKKATKKKVEAGEE
jgi:hypothetical protein